MVISIGACSFMELSPEKYLIDNGNGNYEIDLDILKKDTKSLLEEHTVVFNAQKDLMNGILDDGI
jgi:hypothetical protein